MRGRLDAHMLLFAFRSRRIPVHTVHKNFHLVLPLLFLFTSKCDVPHGNPFGLLILDHAVTRNSYHRIGPLLHKVPAICSFFCVNLAGGHAGIDYLATGVACDLSGAAVRLELGNLGIGAGSNDD